ncbi:MAG: CapA family protein [Christensenellales bacterium]|jgi:poly-gamma-glutamate capsule biosynthesis protein CapA/YwtB (metallophosphatase superfamily)
MEKRSQKRKRRQRKKLLFGLGILLGTLILSGALLLILRGRAPDSLAQSAVTAAEESPELPADTAPTTTPVPTFTSAPTQAPILPIASVRLTFAGDATLGCNMNGNNRRFAKVAEREGYAYFLQNLKEVFSEDDLTVVNLEGPLTTATKKRSNREFNFRGDPAYAAILSEGSVEAASLANNHARDYLSQGLADTAAACKEVGVEPFGYKTQFVTEVNGIRLGFLGFTQWETKQSEMVSAVKNLRSDVDILVVYYHWGVEKAYKPLSAQKKLGRAAIDAGADLVVGGHSHVVGGVEVYKGKRIIYSLGNLCFGGNDTPFSFAAALYRVEFAFDPNAEEVSYQSEALIPIQTSGSTKKNDFQPKLLSGEKALSVLKRIKNCSKSFSETVDFAQMAAAYQ